MPRTCNNSLTVTPDDASRVSPFTMMEIFPLIPSTPGATLKPAASREVEIAHAPWRQGGWLQSPARLLARSFWAFQIAALLRRRFPSASKIPRDPRSLPLELSSQLSPPDFLQHRAPSAAESPVCLKARSWR